MKRSVQERIIDDKLDNDTMKVLVEEGVKFHGHLGPFLILGLKAGLYANNTLGKDCFRTYVIVETETSPPFSCIVDGIQITTGCTMGKRNIELKKGRHLHVTFVKEGTRLKMRLKDKILKELENLKSGEECKRKAISLLNKSIQELFDVKMET